MTNDHATEGGRDPQPADRPVGRWPGSEWADPHSVASTGSPGYTAYGSGGQHQQPGASAPAQQPTAPLGSWSGASHPTSGSWPALPPPQPPRRSGPARTLVIALVAGLLGGLLGGVVATTLAGGGSSSIGVLGQPLPKVDPNTPLGPIEAVAQRVLPSVVQLRVTSGQTRGEGSGMIVSETGLIMTNNHVVDAAAEGGALTVVFRDGTSAAAKIVGRDPTSDVAVIRADGVSGLAPIELGNSESVRVGQQVVAIGSPLGLGGSVTTGIISATDRAVNVGPQNGANDATVLNAIQTDAAINPGNSGGPLVDLQGRAIGINTAIATAGGPSGAEGGNIGVGFSIPINAAQRIAKELEATGRATRAVLGVNVAVGGDDLGGAVIGQVTPGSPAQAAGLLAGEVITKVDDRVIPGGDELVAAIRDHAPGEEITLTVNGRQVVVTLGSQPG